MWDNFKWVIVGFYELLRLVVFQCMFYYRFLPILSGGMWFFCSLATVKLVQSMDISIPDFRFPLLSMLFHLSSNKNFEAIPPPIFIKFFLYKEKYLEFLFVIPFPIFGFWNAMVPFNCIKIWHKRFGWIYRENVT